MRPPKWAAGFLLGSVLPQGTKPKQLALWVSCHPYFRGGLCRVVPSGAARCTGARVPRATWLLSATGHGPPGIHGPSANPDIGPGARGGASRHGPAKSGALRHTPTRLENVRTWHRSPAKRAGDLWRSMTSSDGRQRDAGHGRATICIVRHDGRPTAEVHCQRSPSVRAGDLWAGSPRRAAVVQGRPPSHLGGLSAVHNLGGLQLRMVSRYNGLRIFYLGHSSAVAIRRPPAKHIDGLGGLDRTCPLERQQRTGAPERSIL
jgi:hypothetical protein